MPLFIKPQFNSVWAATGVRLTPEPAKISQGWVVEIPPYEYENWSANRQDALLAHLNQLGVPQWDGTVEYQAGKSYVQGTTTGVVYKAITTNTSINPELDVSNNWQVAFESGGSALLKAQNLADVPDKAAARSNLGIATTEFYDGRYLVKGSNLADVPNKASARQNIDVYSRGEVYTRQQVEMLLPVGQFSYFAAFAAPPGWIVADGRALSQAQYPRLFALFGTYWGGTGTTFNIPDLRGEFVRGLDLGRGVDPSRSFGSIQQSQNLFHSHSLNDPGHNHGQAASAGNSGVGAAFDASSEAIYGYNYTTPSGTGITMNNSGGNESRPRNMALLPCISTGVF